MDRLEALELIVGQAARGELIFPTNVAASIRLQHAVADPACHLEAAADLVMAEPLVAARLVAIANSVAYTRFGGKVSNVRTAVRLLGFNALRSLVAAIVVRQFSGAISDPSLRAQAELLWQHCANVAALAKVLARELTEVDPETALFAGIVHDISGFYLLFRAQELPVLLENAADESGAESCLLLTHGVMQVLKIPKPVALAVESLCNGGCASPPTTLGDVLALANELASIPSPLAGIDPRARIPSTANLDSPAGDKTLRMVLTESEGEIKAMLEALLI